MAVAVRVLALLGVVIPLVVLGMALSGWSHPRSPRSERVVASIVWATSVLVLVGVALGAVGQFRLAWIVGVLAAAAVAAGAWAVRMDGITAGRSVNAKGGVWRAVTGAAVGLMATQWANSAYTAMRTGMTDPDSQHYHLTHAARFVQSGEVFPVHRVSAGDLAAFHPNNDELIRAVGMAATGAEASGLVWVLTTAVLALASAVVVGRSWGQTSAMVAVTTVALVLPGGAREYAGSAANDWAAIALLMAAIALWTTARSGRALVPVGLAAGLALGTKLSVLAPVGIFVVAAVILPHAVARARRAVVVGSACVVAGVWWFARNWIAAGTPVPGLGLPLLDDPAAPLLDEGAFSVLHYATDVGVIREYFLPGLAWSLGPFWWLVLALVGVGIVLGLRGLPAPTEAGTRELPRLLAMVSAISVVAYLLTPTGAAGPPGEPVLFQYNVRYLLPAVVASAWVVALRVPSRAVVATATGMVLITLAMPGSWDSRSLAWAVAAVLAAAAGAVLASRPPAPAGALAVLGMLIVVLVAGPITDRMVEHRYTGSDARSRLLAVGRSLEASDAVGIVGFPLHYAFTGPDLTTRVEYLGHLRDDGAFVDLDSCQELLAAVQRHDLTHVAVLAFPGESLPPAADWLAEADGTAQVVETDAGQLFRTDEPTRSLACADG